MTGKTLKVVLEPGETCVLIQCPHCGEIVPHTCPKKRPYNKRMKLTPRKASRKSK